MKKFPGHEVTNLLLWRSLFFSKGILDFVALNLGFTFTCAAKIDLTNISAQ